MHFAPSIYEHAAALIGRTPHEVSREGELLFRAQSEAFRLYRHAPVFVGIDIYTVEAEAYGMRLHVPEPLAVPCAAEALCDAAAAIGRLPLFDPARAGRLPMLLETGRRLRRAFPEAEVVLPVCGPFSLASQLMGFDQLLCDVVEHPAVVADALRHLVRGQIALCREAARQGLGVAVFESAAAPPLLSPPQFAELEAPALAALVRGANAATGTRVPCIIGGNTVAVLDALLAVGAGYVICPCETDQDAFMRGMSGHRDMMVRVNARLGGFAAGDAERLYHDLDRALALTAGRERVCVGSGALPYNTDPALVLKAKTYVEGWCPR